MTRILFFRRVEEKPVQTAFSSLAFFSLSPLFIGSTNVERKLGGLLVCWMVCLVRLGLLGFDAWLSAVVFGLGVFLCVWVMLLYTGKLLLLCRPTPPLYIDSTSG